MRVFAALFVCSYAFAADPAWLQFGGPNRDFTSPATGLAAAWPAAGPKILWQRDLGEGYSGIAGDASTIYTMYRRVRAEAFIVALDAKTGKTEWEFKIIEKQPAKTNYSEGPGPHATPLVTADKVIATGVTGLMYALDRKTGKPVWQHDLAGEFKAEISDRGYAASALLYRDLVILPVGGAGNGVVAFKESDGSVAWKSGDYTYGGASPLIASVGGVDVLMVFHSNGLAGLNPLNGDPQWKVAHETSYGLNTTMPVAGPDGIVYISSAYGSGCRAVQLTRDGAGVKAKEIWANKRMRLHHTDAVRVGDVIYGSSGDFGPAPMTAIEVKTGKILWQDRALPKANFIVADGKLIVLDEDGVVALAEVSAQGLKIVSRAQVLSNRAWTAPALIGTKLYARDRARMVALELK